MKHDVRYHGGRKTAVAITSMSALLVGDQARREVRIPRRDQLPDDIAWIKDQYNREVPAIIGMTGRVASVLETGTERVAQWNVTCHPNDQRAHERISRPDLMDMIRGINLDLTRIGVARGAWYTAYFAVPKRGGANFFECTYECMGLAKHEEMRRISRSWYPIDILTRLFGLASPIHDPWTDDLAVRREVERAIEPQAAKVLGKVWDKWSQNDGIAPTLRMLGVPIDNPGQTTYRPGNAHQRILSNLRPLERKTMFSPYIPDDYEDVIKDKLQR